jgi:hypothetical protein
VSRVPSPEEYLQNFNGTVVILGRRDGGSVVILLHVPVLVK